MALLFHFRTFDCQTREFAIAVENTDGIFVFKTYINTYDIESSCFYIERLAKTMLWIYGAFKIYLNGDERIFTHISNVYSSDGDRSFDVEFMTNVYDRAFTVSSEKIPGSDSDKISHGVSVSRNGCRVGIDIGGSYIKYCALDNGNVVSAGKIQWQPKEHTNPYYHLDKMREAYKLAAEKLSHVDSLGISTAGVVIDNKLKTASVFLKISSDYTKEIPTLYHRIPDADVPVLISNDGDISALGGVIQNAQSPLLGVSFGTSFAAGYVDRNKSLTSRLNELAFVPINFSPSATIDPWSGDKGCSAMYLSQEGVAALASDFEIALDKDMSVSQKCWIIRDLIEANDERAVKLYTELGKWFGLSIAWFSQFYELKTIMIAGGTVGGYAGEVMLKGASDALSKEFPELYEKLSFMESAGQDQAVTAAMVTK